MIKGDNPAESTGPVFHHSPTPRPVGIGRVLFHENLSCRDFVVTGGRGSGLELLARQAVDCRIRRADFVLTISVEEPVCALTSVEICAGAGGQALGLEQAGFAHAAAVEIDQDACETLRLNRGSEWKIVEGTCTALMARSSGALT